jgi:drug/metabolite transporter (DMT)-like permease
MTAPATTTPSKHAESPRGPSAAKLVAAFGSIYVIWGSTYLAIRVAIETIPPFLMAGVRFLVAGAAMYAWVRARGAPAPEPRHWRAAALIGALLLVGGNGGVVWSEQRVPSGLTALIITTVPIWMVVLEAARPGGTRPARRVFAGTALGIAGLAILLGPEQLLGGGRIDPIGAGVLVLASLSWSIGSLASRHVALPSSALLGTAMEMLAGGAFLTILGLATGDAARFDARAVSLGSIAALLYLCVFGSIVAFTAYVWLLRVTTPARVSTYAYVNPVVAVLLGALLAGEPLTPRVLVASVIILGAVALVASARVRGRAREPRPAGATALTPGSGARPAVARACDVPTDSSRKRQPAGAAR